MSPHRRGSPPDSVAAGTDRDWRAVVDRPIFWIASSAVFVANAILSAMVGRWELAVLELGTGVLALVAAASCAEKGSRRPPAADGESPGGGGGA